MYDNWGALLVIAQAFGYILAVFAYIKVRYRSTFVGRMDSSHVNTGKLLPYAP